MNYNKNFLNEQVRINYGLILSVVDLSPLAVAAHEDGQDSDENVDSVHVHWDRPATT